MCRWRCETVVEKRSMQVGSVYSETMVEVFVIFFIIPCFVMLNAAVPKPRNNMNRPKGVVPEHYVKEVRPPTYKGTPLEVQFSMKVVDINSINVEDMDFRMDMFLKQQWTDARLHIPEEMFSDGDDYFTMPTQFFDNLWHPDLYFINSKVVEIATLTHKFTSVTVYRNKTVRYSARMHAIVACQMEFRHYPMDIQICPLYIESFSYNNQKMQLKWADAGVSVSPELKLLQYHIGTPLEVEEKNVHTSEKGGNFSRLVVYFRFERQIGHHLIQTFAPSTLVVMLSWFSFWLGLDAVPGRMTLLVTCMLTLVTMFTGLRSDIPPVAYVKALDVWMAGCMLFVFAALGEFVVVKVLDQRYQIYRKRESIQNTERALSPWCSCGKEKHNKRKTSLVQITWKNKYGEEYTLWHKIDRLSRIIFPGLFLLFILIYWPALVFGNSYPIID